MNTSQQHSLTVENLRRAIDALLGGRAVEAKAILEAPTAPDIDALSPAFATADAAVNAAHELYIEALRARVDALRDVHARFGAGPFRHHGQLVSLVTRARAGAEQFFLRVLASN